MKLQTILKSIKITKDYTCFRQTLCRHKFLLGLFGDFNTSFCEICRITVNTDTYHLVSYNTKLLYMDMVYNAKYYRKCIGFTSRILKYLATTYVSYCNYKYYIIKCDFSDKFYYYNNNYNYRGHCKRIIFIL